MPAERISTGGGTSPQRPWWHRAALEAVSTVDDPGEMRNVFDDPAHGKQRKELEEMIRARPGEVAEQFGEVVGMS
jgi:hypothetical protein